MKAELDVHANDIYIIILKLHINCIIINVCIIKVLLSSSSKIM